jgi:hypothetical protein
LAAARRECAALVPRDAVAFAKVVAALRDNDWPRFAKALKGANAVQWRVWERARQLQRVCRSSKGRISPTYESDLVCASFLAQAAQRSADAFLRANASWLGQPRYQKTTLKRLARGRSVGSSRKWPFP